MNGTATCARVSPDHVAAVLEDLLSNSTPSTPGDLSDADDVSVPFDLKSVRSGLSDDIGPHARQMQDAAVANNDLAAALRSSRDTSQWPNVTALYAVFDGHGCDDRGSHASHFAADRILNCLTSSKHFPGDIAAALRDAILQIELDYLTFYNSSAAAAAACGGTTVLAAVVWDSTLYVANAGDSRAVLSRRGKALNLTRDHKPQEKGELQRIQSCGGFVCSDGRLCEQIGVSRAIGDFHYPGGLKGDPAADRTAVSCRPISAVEKPTNGVPGPLTAEPEIKQHTLTSQDEFMILACDGFWDIYKASTGSLRAIETARPALMKHNNPQACAEQLVQEALDRHTSDNVTVIVVCFGDDPPKRKLSRYSRLSPSVSSQGLDVLSAALQQDQR